MHHILEWDLGDGNFKQGASVEHTFLEEGTYTIKLNVIDSLSGEILYNQVTYVLPIKDIEQVYITSEDTTVVNEPVRFDSQRTKLANFTIQSYLWNFGDGNISTGNDATHQYKTPGVYNVQLIVESMPDQTGNTARRCGYKRLVVLPRRAR
jgi:PKD repeat protein